MTMRISRSVEFDMGHRVPGHANKCKNPHGHRYKVKVWVEGNLIERKGDSSEGMVMDFGSLKSVLEEYVHDVFDHGFMMYKDDPALDMFTIGQHASMQEWKIIIVDYIPTAENIAIAIWDALEHLGLQGLEQVDVWETPTCHARYKGEKVYGDQGEIEEGTSSSSETNS